MEEHWAKFKALGQKIEEHNFNIESISPPQGIPPSYENSPQRMKSASRLSDVSLAEHKLIDLSRDIRERDRQIAGLMRDVAALESYKAQCLNLKAQVQLLSDKNQLLESELEGGGPAHLRAYEQEAVAMQQTVVSLQSENLELKQALKQKDARVLELKLALESKDHLYEIAQQMKQSLEKNLEAVSTSAAGQQEQLVTYTQILREKEVLVEALEEDNEKLRGELQKALDGLQQCQAELKFMSRLRGDLQQSNQALCAIEKTLEQEQTHTAAVLAENQQLRAVFEGLRQKTGGADPDAHFDLLKRQLEDAQHLLAKTQGDLSVLEQRQTEIDKRLAAARRGLKSYFEKLRAWFESFSLRTDQPLPTPSLPENFKDLMRIVEVCHDTIEAVKVDTLKRISDLEQVTSELTQRNDFFERSTAELRMKVEQFAKQVEAQEALSRQLLQEKEVAERRLTDKYQKLRTRKRTLKAEATLWRSDFQAFTEAVRPVLQEATKVGFTYQNSTEARLFLTDVSNCLALLTAKLAHAREEKEALQIDLDTALRRAEEEANNLAECSQEYMARVQEMNQQITELTHTVAENERSSQELAQKYSTLLDQREIAEQEKTRALSSLEALESQVHTHASRSEQASALLSATLAALASIRNDYLMAKQVLRVYQSQVAASHRALSRYLPQKPSAQPLLKFRQSVVAVIALNRLLKLSKQRSAFRFLGIAIPVMDFGAPEEGLIRNTLAEAEVKHRPGRRQSAPKRLGLALTRVLQILGVREYPQVDLQRLAAGLEDHFDKMNALWEVKGREYYSHSLELKSQRIAGLEQECEALKTRIASLQESHKAHEQCPPLAEFLGLQAERARLQDLQDLQTSHISELEEQLDQYTAVIHGLQDTSLELQSQAQLAAEQVEDLSKEVALKEKHIQSLEGIIKRLEANFDSSQEDIAHSDVMTEEVKRLSKTLELVKAEYTRLEQTVSASETLQREAQSELRRKEAELEAFRKKAEAEIARLKSRIEARSE